MSEEEVIEKLRRAILKYDTDEAKKAAEEALEAKVDPVKAIERGLAEAIREVGERFHRYEIFLPHVVLASDAMTAAMKILEPALPREKAGLMRKGTVVIGTVEGDLHEIGKNVVAMVLKAAGFEVYDLGVDVKSGTFMSKAQEVHADIIGQSSLMTTTMPYMRELIDDLKASQQRDKFKVMVGGGPVTKEWADKIGADGYGRDAHEAVTEAKKLLGIK